MTVKTLSLFVALALVCIAPDPASAQCTGQFAAGAFCGNGTGVAALPRPTQITINAATQVTGLLPIANGGTAAASASAALTSLGALPLVGGTLSGALTLAADPLTALGAATKQYVDGLAAGLSVKESVKAASVATVNLASAPASLDGVAGVLNDRWLLKNQTLPKQNGIYIFASTGAALTRATDLDLWAEAIGAFTFVTGGSTNAATGWAATAAAGGIIDTTDLPFTQYSASTAYSAGSGLNLAGSVFSIPALGVTNAMLAGSITAAKITTGTSGANIPLTNGANTWSAIQTLTLAPVFTDASGTRTALGLGTAAVAATGASAHTLPFLDGTNTWSAINTLAGMSNPQLLFSPSSGATKTGSLSQNTDVLQLGASGVAVYGAFNLNTGAFSLTPTAASLGQGIVVTQTGPVPGAPNNHATDFAFNSVVVTEAVNQTTSSTILSAFSATDNINGSSASGQRAGIRGDAILLAPTSPTSVQRDYTGGTFVADARANDNGTNTGGGALGNFYAINPIAVARSGATNLAQLTGGEIDVSALTGSSVAHIFGLSYVRGGQLQAAGIDAAIHTVSGPDAHWGDLIHIGGDAGGGLSVRNAVIETDGTVGTIAKGIDLSNGGTTTITGNAWTSNGAVIDGSGNAIFTAYWVAGVGPGLSCSGPPTGAFTVTHGIVTTC